MKKILITMISALILIGCGGGRQIVKSDAIMGSSMKTVFEMTATQHQVDSICTADTLPNIDTWSKTIFTDYETGEKSIKMIYVKSNEGKQTTYVILGMEEPYKVTKRVAE